jgi:peptide deformylase
MRSARGIGLAANQVGVPVQVLIHKMDSVAPAMLINPTLLRQSGVWEYNEGCLSLKVDETAAPVRRPKSVMVRAATIEGKTIVLNADELLARVLLHEIDHLSGIEYVQRLVGRERSRVYQAMRERGIDVACMPPKPYDDFSPGRAVTNTGRV